MRTRERPGRRKPRVVKVLFFVDRGKRRRVDRRKPFRTRLRVTFRPGTKHHVHARVYFPAQRHQAAADQDGLAPLAMCRSGNEEFDTPDG